MKKYLFLLYLTLLFLVSYSQDDNMNRCGTGKYYQIQKQKDSALEIRLNEVKAKILSWLKNNKNLKSNGAIITIPVVFHIVYNTPEENISNAQIYSQLDVLNEDYRRINFDAIKTPDIFKPVASDCHIEFCLAQQTPDGKPTNGIIRKNTNVDQFQLDNGIKFSANGGDNIWDRSRYLNIWSGNIPSDIAGYSSFPGENPLVDGVVINYRVFGRTGNHHSKYNKGRTATHEIGHWFGLYHPWGDSEGESCNGICTCSDYCADTPTQQEANMLCPVYPHPSCSDTSDMFMNYMDYTNDSCMNIFTHDQNQIMIATLNTNRASIKTSDVCSPLVSLPNADFTANHTQIPATKTVNYNIITSDNFAHLLWIFDGGKPDTSNLKAPQNITYNKTGRYTVTLIASNNTGTIRVTKYNYIEVDTTGKKGDINLQYTYFKDNTLYYYYKYDTIGINFGKDVFYNVKIDIFDIIGKRVAYFQQENDFFTEIHKVVLPASLTKGIYIIRIQTQDGIITKKIMILH